MLSLVYQTYGGSRTLLVEPVTIADDSRLVSAAQTHRCFRDLRSTDKQRIEEINGGLLSESCRWILHIADFRHWRDDMDRRLLWIKGDPGKGKTMLLCCIIDELKKSKGSLGMLSFFFCRATDSRLNNATSVFRGLTYILVDQQPHLILHL